MLCQRRAACSGEASNGHVMKRDFSTLTAQEALHIAIFVEERNGDLYRQFAEMFNSFGDRDSSEIADVFEDMADEEETHGTLLQERYFQRFGDEICLLTEEDIREVIELPRLESDMFAIARSGVTTSPRNHALKVALHAEQSAHRFYTHLLQYAAEPDLQGLYQELAQFEDDHVEWLRSRLEGRQAGGDVRPQAQA